MPAEAAFLGSLEVFHSALIDQLDASRRLLEATQELGTLLDTDGVDPEALEQAVSHQATCFSAARRAEHRTRRERTRLQECTGLANLDGDLLRAFLDRNAKTASGSELEHPAVRIQSAIEELSAVTQTLAELTGDVMHKLQQVLQSVGQRSRTMARGRHAAHAYAGGRSANIARFIDQRE